MSEQIFTECPNCHETWSTQEEFITDEQLEITGYEADFDGLERGRFLFTHRRQSCQSTLTVRVMDFVNLYRGEIFPERKTKSSQCPLYCIDSTQLNRCTVVCECAYVREIIQMIKEKRTFWLPDPVV